MNSSRAIKLLGLIAVVAVLNIAILSPGLMGVEIGGDSVLETAAGVTLLFVSLLVVLYGSYALLFKPAAAIPVREIQTREDYSVALGHYAKIKAVKKDIDLALDQLDRIDKKKSALLDVLRQRFEPAEMSYQKFNSVIAQVENLFYANVRGILNKLNVFDASGLAKFAGQQSSARFSSRIVQEKTELYNEYLSYVAGYIGANEEILLKLDKLLLEISLLGSMDYRDIDGMPCMQEIDSLIKQTKFYKQ